MGRYRPVSTQRDFDRVKRDVERQNRHSQPASTREDRFESRRHEQRENKRERQSSRHAPRQMREEMPQKEKSQGFFSRKISNYRNRNSPENRSKRISEMRLVAQEENLKTQIHLAKEKRGGGILTKIVTAGQSRSTGRSSGRRSSRSSSWNPGGNVGHSDVGMGLNDLFGTGSGNTSQRSSKKNMQRDGLSELFG